MADIPPVHVELKDDRWAVIREGSERALSLHPTQSAAAAKGRAFARREGTEFFLHAQDGRVREHRNYGEGSPTAASEDRGIVDQATEMVGEVTGGLAGAAARAAGAAGAANLADEVRGSTGARQGDTSSTLEERYAGHEIYDRDGERIGKLDDLFVDENDNPEYLGVWTDSLGTRSILIPAEGVTVEDNLRRTVVLYPRSLVEAAPSLGQGEELTPSLEERVRMHYGLASTPGTEVRGGYGGYYGVDAEHAQERGGTAEQSVPERDEEELRVSRSEEELRVGTREREAGALRVRKRVRTDRERIVVPKKRVEVTVERVPVVEGEAARPEIGEDEIVVPIVEEEVVVEKRQVVKEELRIRKEVVEEAEVVEEDVRREEIEVDDHTGRRDG